MVYISIVCKTSRPTDCLRPRSPRSRRLQPAVIRLFFVGARTRNVPRLPRFHVSRKSCSLVIMSLDFRKVLRTISSGSGAPSAKDFSFLQRAKFTSGVLPSGRDMQAEQSDVVVSSACQSSGTERIAVCFAFCEGTQGSRVDRNLLKVPLVLLFYYL